MNGWAVLPAGVFVVLFLVVLSFAALAVVIAYSVRKESQADRDWEAKHRRDMDEVVDQLGRENESRRGFAALIVRLPWPEARALCEAEFGRPCECATKQVLAENIWWARYNRMPWPQVPEVRLAMRISSTDA